MALWTRVERADCRGNISGGMGLAEEGEQAGLARVRTEDSEAETR